MDDHARVLQIIAMKSQAPLILDQASALLVIDMQKDFVHPEYGFAQLLERLVPGITDGYFSRVRSTVVPNVQRLLATFRRAELPVFFTATGTQVADGADLSGWLRDFDALGLQVMGERVWPRAGDAAWQIDESVSPAANELLVNKTAADPLGCTAIDQSLRNLGVKSVVVCGLTTDVCVTSAARGCADRGYRTVIASDACATLSPEMHNASLDIFRLAFGQVKTTEEIAGVVPQRAVATV
jgi:nicotinamidase-related amidase